MAEPKQSATADKPDKTQKALQVYQIFAQTILGLVGVGGYIVLLALVILHVSPWTSFQENQIAAALGFLAGTIVAGVFGYAFGSSFGSMTKTAAMEQRLDQSKKDQSNGEDCVEGEK